MGNREDDRRSRMGMRPDEPESHGHRRGASYERDEDMGGSRWSGASGRGGMSFDERYRNPEYGHPRDDGYRGERGYPRDVGYEYSHVSGQRWSGGYGGDRGPGSGFTGSDFGPPPGGGYDRDRERHFGNAVDRGGRMGPGGESTTGRGYWGWESDRAGGVNVGPMGGRGQYGEGTDMGMGAPDEDRGPHYGKGPKGYKRSDERTREDVCEAIAHQGHIDASEVEVKVESGIVTLSGTVAHRHEKRRLEELVMRCRGVDDVHNELRLKRSEPSRQPIMSQVRGGDGNANEKNEKNGKSARS